MPFTPGHPHVERRIVVVDDNPKFLILVRSLLREFGFKFVHDFTDAKAAFYFMTETHVDLALVDLLMPRANGFQFADRVRHADVIVNRVVPLVLMTSHVNLQNLQKAINHGIDEVLLKPFSPRQLHERLFGLLDKPRVYIKTPSGYFGPDRRRRDDPHYSGPERRKSDAAQVVTEEILLEMRHEARKKYGPLPASPLEPTPLQPVLVGPVTMIPVVAAETVGGRLVAKVPTPLREAVEAAAAAAARKPAASAPPAPVAGPPPAGSEPVYDRPIARVPIAPPPKPKAPKPAEEVHFLD